MARKKSLPQLVRELPQGALGSPADYYETLAEATDEQLRRLPYGMLIVLVRGSFCNSPAGATDQYFRIMPLLKTNADKRWYMRQMRQVPDCDRMQFLRECKRRLSHDAFVRMCVRVVGWPVSADDEWNA